MIASVKSGNSIPVYGTGENVRDWLYVEDHVEAIDMILRKATEHGVAAGIHNGTPEYALRMIEKGFRFVTIGSDSRLMALAAKGVLTKMREDMPEAPSSSSY